MKDDNGHSINISDIMQADKDAAEFAALIAKHMPGHQCQFLPSEIAAVRSMIRWGRVVVYAAITAGTSAVVNLVVMLAGRI